MNNQIEIHNKDAFKKMHNAGTLAANVPALCIFLKASLLCISI